MARKSEFELYDVDEKRTLHRFIRARDLDGNRTDVGIRYIEAVLDFLDEPDTARRNRIYANHVDPVHNELVSYFTAGEVKELTQLLRDKHFGHGDRMSIATRALLEREAKDVRKATA